MELGISAGQIDLEDFSYMYLFLDFNEKKEKKQLQRKSTLKKNRSNSKSSKNSSLISRQDSFMQDAEEDILSDEDFYTDSDEGSDEDEVLIQSGRMEKAEKQGAIGKKLENMTNCLAKTKFG